MTEGEATPSSRHTDGVTRSDGTIDPAHRVTLSYIDRSRRYYAAEGYERPYRWLTNESAPFHKPGRPVAVSRLAVVTTSFPAEDYAGPTRPTSIRTSAVHPPPQRMYTEHLFWHKEATDTDDIESFLPLGTLARFVEDGRLGSVNDRFFSVPTTYSRRSTQRDAETVTRWCSHDDVDLVVLIPL